MVFIIFNVVGMQKEIIGYLSTVLPLVIIPWILFYMYLRYRDYIKREKDNEIK